MSDPAVLKTIALRKEYDLGKVKVEGLKDSAGVKRRMTKAQQLQQPPVIPRIRRVPQQRSYRR